MHWLALLVIPGFIYFRLNSSSDTFKEEKESWPFILLVLVASGVFLLLARILEVILDLSLPTHFLAGLDAQLRSFWRYFIPDFTTPDHFLFTLIVASMIAIIIAKSIRYNIFQPLFRENRNEDLLKFLKYFMDPLEYGNMVERIPAMVEAENGKVYIGLLMKASLDSGEDPDSKFLIVRPSFSAIRTKDGVLDINTFYTPNHLETKPIDILIRWNTVKTVQEFDIDYMLECVKTGTVQIDEKIASLITMESGE